MATSVKPLLRSFAGGEITPEMFGRLDLDKFQSGIARSKNMRVLPHGPAQNRPGFQYVLQARNSLTSLCRLIPFAFSADQTMILEFTEQKVRFHTNGATLLEANQALTAPYMTQANPGVWTIAAHGYSNGDWLYCSAITTTFSMHGRFLIVANATANTFTLTDLRGSAIDTTSIAVPAFLVNFARVYEVTTPFISSELMDLHYTQSADVLTITHPSYAPRELRRLGATNWTLTSASFAPLIATPAAPATTPGGPGGGTPINHTYVTTAISEDTYEESLASASDTESRDLSVAGNYIDVTTAAVTGAVRYNIYKLGTGGLYGYIGQSDGTAFKDDNIVPDLTLSPPEASTPFASSGNYPSTCTYIEQRRVFAATDNKPQNVWMTRSATEGNLSQSVPVRDNDAIIFRIAATQQNRIRHLVPLVDLIALTTGGEWRIYAANSDALTPASTTPKIQSFIGANNVQPCLSEASVLYAQAQGGHIREFAYAGSGINGATYSTNDVSILAPHLFDGYSIVDMAYSRTSSCPILWCARSDGVLLGMTYVPGQNVRAWHWHETEGRIESVACVAEGEEDALYAAVVREVDGVEYRYVERLHSRRFTDKEDAFFVDSGLTYDGAATDTIRGLWHLEGWTVQALADGAVVNDLVVTDGAITLPVEASVVQIGLRYTSNFRTLPLSWQADGFGQGAIKNVNKVHLRLSNSSGIHIGPADGDLVEVKQRTNEPYDSAPNLITGWKHVNIAPQWQDDGGIEIEQANPLPITILAMVLDTVAGG